MPKKPAKKAQSKTRKVARPKKVVAKQPKTVRSPAKRGVRQADVIPGELLLGQGDIVAFEGLSTTALTVVNTGDRPVQVGSHCHFFEANRALRFDREKAFGFRLCIPAGTAVRFEPGEEKRVTLVAIGGKRVAYGINGLTNGSLDDREVRAQALSRAAEHGFIGKGSSS